MTKLLLKSSPLLTAFVAMTASAQGAADQASSAPASPVVVGLFVLLFVGIIALFFVWMVRSSKRHDADEAEAAPAPASAPRE
ncbi:MAG: hypothetical protein AB7L76_01315 [Burkholderiaceae bacterium]